MVDTSAAAHRVVAVNAGYEHLAGVTLVAT